MILDLLTCWHLKSDYASIFSWIVFVKIKLTEGKQGDKKKTGRRYTFKITLSRWGAKWKHCGGGCSRSCSESRKPCRSRPRETVSGLKTDDCPSMVLLAGGPRRTRLVGGPNRCQNSDAELRTSGRLCKQASIKSETDRMLWLMKVSSSQDAHKVDTLN